METVRHLLLRPLAQLAMRKAHRPASSSTADRYQVMLHVSAETSRRICCDSNISPVVNRGLSPNWGQSPLNKTLNIGRKSRVIPPPMRRALRARDENCRFPGCTHRHFIDGHHIRHWADGGETGLDNLVLLCRHHHRLVHEGGFACERSATGQLLFRDERGGVIGISGTVPAITDNPKAITSIRNRLEDLHIDAGTCVRDLSGGISMDYPLAVELLWYRDFPIGPAEL